MKRHFPRQERIGRKRDFDRVFREGCVIRAPEMTVRAAPNDIGHPRLGLSVGRRLGGAVRRNRIKRLLREAYRLNRLLITASCDIVIVPRTQWTDLSLGAIQPSFRRTLRKIEQTFAAG